MAAHPDSQSASPAADGFLLLPMGHHQGKPPVPLSRPVTVIGSRSTARIHLISSSVSKAHALLVKSNGGMYIRDLASRSHLYINGDPVRETDLSDGDLIKIGSFVFKYQGPSAKSTAASAPAAELDVTGGDFPIAIDERVILIGRRSSADVVLLEDSASTAHAVIFEMDGERYIRDLGSRTGTFVNGVNTHQHKLSQGDVIRVGETDIRYLPASHSESAQISEESAAGYALEAPQEEVQLDANEPHDEHETIGGLDLVGELVTEEVAQRGEAAELDAPVETDEADQLEPLPLDEALRAGSRQGIEDAADAPLEPIASGSADIEDLQDELLGEQTGAKESLSVSDLGTESKSRSEKHPSIDASVKSAEWVNASTEPLEDELHPRRGWRSHLHADEPPIESASPQIDEEPERPIEQDEPAIEAPEQQADQPEPQADDLASEAQEDRPLVEPVPEAAAVEQIQTPAQEEVTEPETELEPVQLDQTKEVLKFPDSISTLDDDATHSATAVLDQHALAPEPSIESDFDVDDSLVGAVDEAHREDLDVEPPELKLDFAEPLERPTPGLAPLEPVELGDLKLEVKDEPLPPLDDALHIASDEPAAPALDFSIKEPVDPLASLLEIEKLPAPPLKLADDSEALASAAFVPPPPLEPADPFVGLENLTPSDVPELAPLPEEEESHLQLEALVDDVSTPQEPVEVLDPSRPEPESALSLDEPTKEITLDDSAIARTQGTKPSADELSDTRFTRAVEDFTGPSVGEIVEPKKPAPAPPPATAKAPVPSKPAVEAPQKADKPKPVVPAEKVKPVQKIEAPKKIEPPAKIEAPAKSEAPKKTEPPSAPPQALPKQKSPLADPFAVGANQENFLGGIPFPPPKIPKLRVKPVPLNRDPVDELIAEIDHAAAAAERASADVPGQAPPVAPHAKPQTPGSKPAQRTAELGLLAARIDETIPPFNGPDPTTGNVTTGFDGLAMPPVRQTDVFSQMSPPAMDSPAAEPAAPITGRAATVPGQRDRAARRARGDSGAFAAPPGAYLAGGIDGGAMTKDAPEIPVADLRSDEPEQAPRRRVRPALPDPPPVTERRPPVVYAPEELEVDPAKVRGRYLRRAMLLMVLTVVAAVGAVVGVYSMVPVRSTVEARITYDVLADRTKRDQQEIQADQLRRVRSDYLREAARRRVLRTPEVSPGFLDDPVQYSRMADRAYWPDGVRPASLVVTYDGTQKDADVVRMKALAMALYEDNQTMVNEARRARERVQGLKEEIARNSKRKAELDGEIASQRVLYERKPSTEHLRMLEDQLARREEAWKRAVAAVKDAEAELNRIRQGGAIDAVAGDETEIQDEELTQMTAELEQLQQRVQSARDAASEKAREARQQLDGTMEGFQQEIASAGAAMESNPELAAYIASAQRLQESTQQLIDDLIRRQEQQFNSLMELKARLNEKMEARRSEQWQNDKELQDLTERLAILTRQYNAAVGGGLKQESEDLKVEVDLTKNMIKARQDLIPVDPGYAEAIQQLELFVASTQKTIEEDRKRTDELLAKLQSGFRSSPQIDRLPAEQKELARRLVDRLEAINDAREQYNRTMDAGAAQIDPQLQQQIIALQSGIDARRKQLVDQRTTAVADGQVTPVIQQKQTELTSLKQSEKKSEEAYFASREELESARRAESDARASYEKLEKLESERATVQTWLKTQNDTLVDAEREVKTAVAPLPPTDNDIRITAAVDQRPMFAIISAGSMLLICGSLVVMTLVQASREAPSALAPSDLRPIAHPHPQPTPNGNGQTAGAPSNSPTNGNEDDHEPVIV